jgi:Protein of unknown function (DUF3604)
LARAAAARRWLALAVALGIACGSEPGGPDAGAHGPGAPNANPELEQALRVDRTRVRHAADGGGRAWLEAPPWRVRAAEPGRFVLIYEAGPLGIAVGGTLLLQVPPYWDWSTPQLEAEDAAGFTRVSTPAEGVVLTPETVDLGLLAIRIGGRALVAGERVRIEYGAGPAGALADRFAERESPFFFGVDGDGDGVRAWIAAPPAIDVAAGPPARLVLHLPATGRPGAPLTLRAAVLDAAGNAGVAFEGTLRLELPPGVEGPGELRMPARDAGLARTELRLPGYGIVRVRAQGPGDLVAESNPCVVTPDVPRLLFADLHGHSNLSDGTGTPEDYYRYARDVAGLDAAALTDHDHWGIPFLDETPANWRRIEAAAKTFHDPGRFVTLLGYEWTHWIYGHRHVLHFEDTAPLRSSLDPRFDTPAELWAALAGAPALTFAHHSAGEPVATDWSIAPDPVLEPVTEIVSVHGSSESLDSPRPLRGMLEGNSVRDALARGYRLGFVGSGDSHDGHPGLVQLATDAVGGGGLAGIYAAAATREAVLEALRARRVYATNGPRIVLQVALDGAPMGATLPAGGGKQLEVRVAAPGPIEAIELITPAGVVAATPGEGKRSLAFESSSPELAVGSWLYLRVRQQDGGAAWSSPFFFE